MFVDLQPKGDEKWRNLRTQIIRVENITCNVRVSMPKDDGRWSFEMLKHNVWTGSESTDTTLRLLELPAHLLDCLSRTPEGEACLTLKSVSMDDSNAYICSDGQTLQLRSVHQSNSLLLATQSMQNEMTIIGKAPSYLEAITCPHPRFDMNQVPSYLGNNAPAAEEGAAALLFEDLMHRSPLSDEQTDDVLRREMVIKFEDGRACKLDPQFAVSLLKNIVNTCVEYNLSLNNLTIDNTVLKSIDEPPCVLDTVLKALSEESFERKFNITTP